MNKESNININMDEAILLRYFSGTLEKEEKEKVETWISFSEENKKVAKQVYYIYRATDVIQTVNEIDSNKALLRGNKRLTGRKKLNWWEWSVRTAAVLFIPLFLFSLYIFYSRTTDVDQYVEVRANPGMTTKVVLPDGSEVWLNSASYLKYPVQFTKYDRRVELEGEAYFSVKKDAGRRVLLSRIQRRTWRLLRMVSTMNGQTCILVWRKRLAKKVSRRLQLSLKWLLKSRSTTRSVIASS